MFDLTLRITTAFEQQQPFFQSQERSLYTGLILFKTLLLFVVIDLA